MSPNPRLKFRKSAPVSPTVVARTLITQNASVTRGTLLNMGCRTSDFIKALLRIVDADPNLGKAGQDQAASR